MNEAKYSVDVCYDEKEIEQSFSNLDNKVRFLFSKKAKGKDRKVFAVRKEERLVALYVFLYLPQEKYMEMIFQLSNDILAFDYLLQHLADNYWGYLVDFVFDKDDDMLNSLKKYACSFEKEQYVMKLVEFQPVDIKHNIISYCEKYKQQYCDLHSQDVYWTAQKVIEAPGQFRIFLCVENEEVAGYVDMTYCFTVNEPFDVYVKEQFRNQGICKELLTVALNSNENKNVELMVDYDNIAALKAYSRLGFEKSKGLTCTVHWYVK
ncbi:MAG: GNAT family N-acetyltransferase [Erysipelotrichaceae bacterium]